MMTQDLKGKQLYDYKIKLFRDAQSFMKPSRTPFSANVTHWMFHDAGYTLATAIRDYDIVEQCALRFARNYPVDQLNIFMSAFRNYDLLTDALGGSGYEGNDGTNFVAEELISPEEYDDFIADFNKATWEKFFLRKFSKAADYTPQQFAEAVKTYLDYLDARERIDQRLRDAGIVVEKDLPVAFCSLQILFDGMRGIKGLSLDLRRHPDKIKAFCEAGDPESVAWTLDQIGTEKGPDLKNPYDAMVSILAHTILNQKQFAAYKAPVLEKVIRHCETYNKQIINFAEGSWIRFGDFFNQFRKGTLCMMVEQDDPFEIRRKYPNISLYGGLEVNVMRNGTKQQCIDMAKKAIDELGCDGGLILAPTKMLAYPNDMNGENLRAVCEFVQDYK